ncbi:3-keto-disaccharide hydrolase [Flagellimonas sp. 2504JD1-5]
MKLFFIFFCFAVFATPCLGQDDITGDADFVTLFNGENLDGWIGNKKSYRAENGNIIVDPNGGGSGGNLFTEGQYSNFVFKFEFQLTPGANNGLGIHAPLEGDVAYVGKELQILDNSAEKYAKLKPYQYHGSVYGVISAKRGFLKPVGEWNEQVVTVNGSKIQIVLNDNIILDGDFQEASKNGTLDKNEHPGLQRTRGHIGFLGHGDVVRFRNVKIKELPSE